MKNEKPRTTDADLFKSLEDACPDREMLEALKRLVTEAGHVTVRDLFACTADDVGAGPAEAIARAKKFGFLALSNDRCCHETGDPFTDDYCKTSTGKWCSRVKRVNKLCCTLASDKC